jgi:hemolysin III
LARYREAVISLAAAFGTSADFHRFAHSVTARRRMGRLDHSMFYVLLAGTFTPVCVHGRWQASHFAMIWVIATA